MPYSKRGTKVVAAISQLSIQWRFRQMPLSLRATAGCFAFIALIFARAASSQVATNSTLTSSPSQSNTVSPEPAMTQGPPVSPEYRRLQYHLNLGVRGVYDDNIGLTSQNKISDYSVRVDPTLSLGYGDLEPGGANYLHLAYAPDFVFFLDHSEFNAYQHSISLGAQSVLSRLTLGLSGNVQFLKGFDSSRDLSTGAFVNQVNLDVRGRPQTTNLSAQATASYDLGGKTSLSAGVQTNVTDYSQFISSQTLSGNLFVNYAYGPKLTLGIGGTGGRQFVDASNADETFEQANFRASYLLTDKLSASGSVGIEFREYDSGKGTYISPVFDLGLTYTPFDGSAFSLSGSRRTTNSASLAGQDYTDTQFTVSGSQRFLQRFFLRLTGGYENVTYLAAIPGISSPRQDNYYFIEPEIDVKITRFWYAGGFYLHRRDDSSLSIFGFDENQAGIRFTFTF
jgi:hypothetical protein